MGLTNSSPIFIKQIDNFTAPTSGTTINVATTPISKFTISASTTGILTSWIIILEGSIDGTNFTPIVTHTNLIRNNVAIFSGVNLAPCLYFRTRCSEITLGLGTSITVTVIGVQ